jgi:hypothetical protein
LLTNTLHFTVFILRTSTSSSYKCFLRVVPQKHLRIQLLSHTNNLRQPSFLSRFDHWNCNSWCGVQNMNLLIMRLTISLYSSSFGTNIFLRSKLSETFRVLLQVHIFYFLYCCLRNSNKSNSGQNERIHRSKYLLFVSLYRQFWYDTFAKDVLVALVMRYYLRSVRET